MKKFEAVDILLHFHNWYVKGEGIINYAAQGIGLYVFAKERICDAVGNFLEREVGNIIPKTLGQLLDNFWHIESTVLGEAANNSFAQRGTSGSVVSGVVEHWKVEKLKR